VLMPSSSLLQHGLAVLTVWTVVEMPVR
jgi:hypothetical protein